MSSKTVFRAAVLRSAQQSKRSSKTSYKRVPRRGSPTTSGTDTEASVNKSSSENLAKLPTLTSTEYSFFNFVKDGDLNGLKDFIESEEFQNININKTDRFGFSALHYAVRRQDDDIVTLLMSQKDILTYDTLFYAIEEENVSITNILLKREDEIRPPTQVAPSNTNQGKSFALSPSKAATAISLPPSVKASPATSQKNIPPSPAVQTTSKRSLQDLEYFDSNFPTYMNPFLKAAQMGNFELMEIFYSRGERLESPEEHHNMGCACRLCSRSDKSLRSSDERNGLFDALTNPQYICFITGKTKMSDPINYAISKIEKCKDFATKEHEFEENYQNYIKRLQELIKDFLNLCRTNEETDLFMRVPDLSVSQAHWSPDGKYPRLWKFVDMRLVDVVSHPHAQFIVQRQWTTKYWSDWYTYSTVRQMMELMLRIIFLPFIAIILWFGSKGNFNQKLVSPVSRYLNYVATYFIFLAILSAQIFLPQRCNNLPDRVPYATPDGVCEERGEPNVGTEWPLILYFFGFTVSMLKRHSIPWFWRSHWAYFEIVSQLLFVITFIFWLIAWIQKPESEPRAGWSQNYPEILAESVLSIAVIFAFARVFRFIELHRKIGPLQIALGRIVYSFFSSVAVYVLVMFIFTSGLLAIYEPFYEMEGFDSKGEKKKQESPFGNAWTCLEELFWVFFGLSGSDKPNIVSFPTVKNTTGGKTTIVLKHPWINQKAGSFIFGCYQIIGITMMFNMLVAYFTGHADEVLGNADAEWKFRKTEMYMSFMKETVLPPPFNLLPTLRGILRFFEYIGLLCFGDSGGVDGRASCSLRQCCYIEEPRDREDDARKRKAYRNLVLQLTHRYKGFIIDKANQEPATSDDVKEIEEELTELKSQVETKLREMEQQLQTQLGASASQAQSPPIVATKKVSSEELDLVQKQPSPPQQGKRKSSVVVTFPTRTKRLMSQLESIQKLSAAATQNKIAEAPDPPPMPSSPVVQAPSPIKAASPVQSVPKNTSNPNVAAMANLAFSKVSVGAIQNLSDQNASLPKRKSSLPPIPPPPTNATGSKDNITKKLSDP